MYASREGHLEVVETLIIAGADVNAKTNNGSTSLMIAAKVILLRIGYHWEEVTDRSSRRGTLPLWSFCYNMGP